MSQHLQNCPNVSMSAFIPKYPQRPTDGGGGSRISMPECAQCSVVAPQSSYCTRMYACILHTYVVCMYTAHYVFILHTVSELTSNRDIHFSQKVQRKLSYEMESNELSERYNSRKMCQLTHANFFSTIMQHRLKLVSFWTIRRKGSGSEQTVLQIWLK